MEIVQITKHTYHLIKCCRLRKFAQQIWTSRRYTLSYVLYPLHPKSICGNFLRRNQHAHTATAVQWPRNTDTIQTSPFSGKSIPYPQFRTITRASWHRVSNRRPCQSMQAKVSDSILIQKVYRLLQIDTHHHHLLLTANYCSPAFSPKQKISLSFQFGCVRQTNWQRRIEYEPRMQIRTSKRGHRLWTVSVMLSSNFNVSSDES